MIKSKWKIHVRHEPQWACHSMFMVHEDQHGQSLVTNMTLEKISRHGAGPTKSDGLEVIPGSDVEGFLTACMDAAWGIGLRPTGFKDHTNELTAVRYHLEDMRKLAKVSDR